MKILNLGCGTKVCNHLDVINIDWSIELRLRRNQLSRRLISRFSRGSRVARFNALSDNILVHNLAKGIPFATSSVDVVYHSHLLEHLDRDIAERFLQEAKRVLKPGGIQRIVVPDLEKLCTDYMEHLSRSEGNETEACQHDRYIAKIIEQCVRRESYGSSQQKRLLRAVENFVLGDARKRGETHQWMYDRVNLSNQLTKLGYQDPVVHHYNSSSIVDWDQYGLDQEDKGSEYKPDSLYIEARK